MASGRAFGIRAARSGAGGAGRKLTQAGPFSPAPRPIPTARAMGYSFSPCRLGKRPCVLAAHGFPRIPSESAIPPFQVPHLGVGCAYPKWGFVIFGRSVGRRKGLPRPGRRPADDARRRHRGPKGPPHVGRTNSSGGRKRLPKPFAAASPRRLSTRAAVFFVHWFCPDI